MKIIWAWSSSSVKTIYGPRGVYLHSRHLLSSIFLYRDSVSLSGQDFVVWSDLITYLLDQSGPILPEHLSRDIRVNKGRNIFKQSDLLHFITSRHYNLNVSEILHFIENTGFFNGNLFVPSAWKNGIFGERKPDK